MASIILPELDFAIIMNEVPHAKSSLLADGELWNAEPISASLFQGFLPQSTVLFELQEHQSVVSLLYDGVECAILNVEDAEELSSAIRFSTANGALPLVRGRVSHSPAGTFIEIDALPLNKWTKIQRRLGALKIPLLVPYQADTQLYKESVKTFSDRIAGKIADVVPVATFADKAVKYSPYLTLAAGTASLAGSIPASSIHSHHLVGYSLTGLILIALAIGTLFARSRSGSSQWWNLFSSVGLMTSVPVFAFITANTYLDATSTEISAEASTRLTTLANRPTLSSSPSANASEGTLDQVPSTSGIPLPRIIGDTTVLASDLDGNIEGSTQIQLEAIAHPPLETLIASPTPISSRSQATTSWEYEVSDESVKTTVKRPTTSTPTVALPPTFILEPPPLTPTDPSEETTEETTEETPEPSETSEVPQPSGTPTNSPMISTITEPTSESNSETTEASVETTEASIGSDVSEPY